MRALVTSSAIILSFIIVWLVFCSFSENTLSSFADTIENSLIYNVENENWSDAKDTFEAFRKDWRSYRNIAHLFLSSAKLNEIDYTFARIMRYIENQNASDAAGELAYLERQMYFLHQNEKATLTNIF